MNLHTALPIAFLIGTLSSGAQGTAGPKPQLVARRFSSMATQIELTLPVQGTTSDAAYADVIQVFERVDAVMNEWRAHSPLSDVNRAAGGPPVPVPFDLLHLLKRSKELAALTNGAFEPTWAALWDLWDFSGRDSRVPEPASIRERLPFINYRHIIINEEAGTARLERSGALIGLGGIAKGYALSQAAVALRKRGIQDFMISAGGQVQVGGLNDGRPWRVGIRDPRGAPEDYFAILEATDVSISTSGDYERYFVKDGVRYHHILDPSNGLPARGLRCATVIARDGVLADALSTAVMVMGPERGLKMIEEQVGVDAILVDDHGKLLMTDAMRSRLVLRHAPLP